MNCKHNWCEGYTDPVDPQETEPIRICIKCGLIQGWKAWDAVWDEKSNYYLNRPTENKEQPANGSVALQPGQHQQLQAEIAFLQVIKSVLLSEIAVSENQEIRRLYETINERIAQLSAMQ